MTTPELAPRGLFGGVIAVWIAGGLTAIAIGVFVPLEWRAAWLTIGLGACLLLAFVVQLTAGRSKGFIDRVAGSVLGALLVMGIISAGFGLAALFQG
ncbi:MAG TPA: hypothetical protein VNT50_08575 [Microbacterium sp.]|uniref:hypothetical protein n=1 Tax=Microbacterium sp. TaxID=51671 RepID=UPI002CA0BA91|nr:hypothetical protein [Microbacterium sp.]HWI31534.1 hypothetical protein [Microbacterium sp.]